MATAKYVQPSVPQGGIILTLSISEAVMLVEILGPLTASKVVIRGEWSDEAREALKGNSYFDVYTVLRKAVKTAKGEK